MGVRPAGQEIAAFLAQTAKWVEVAEVFGLPKPGQSTAPMLDPGRCPARPDPPQAA